MRATESNFLFSANVCVGKTPAKSKPIMVRLPIRNKVIMLMFGGVMWLALVRMGKENSYPSNRKKGPKQERPDMFVYFSRSFWRLAASKRLLDSASMELKTKAF